MDRPVRALAIAIGLLAFVQVPPHKDFTGTRLLSPPTRDLRREAPGPDRAEGGKYLILPSSDFLFSPPVPSAVKSVSLWP
jgi:hypothetical protein